MKGWLTISLLIAFTACNGDSAPPTPSIPASPTPTTASELPAAVEQKRDSIVRAARAMDYDALEALLDPETFNYSFGDSGDPIGHWKQLESESHVPILGDIMPAVFATRPAKQGGIYVWPAAAAKEAKDWTDEEVEDLLTFNNEEDVEQHREQGGYLGWRGGIQAEGAWLYFIAGD